MFDRIRNSFALARSSWDVLRQNRRFILFPIFSGIGCTLVLASFAVPLAIAAMNGGFDVHAHKQPPWWTYVIAFAFYFCNYFVIVFCNSALISCAVMTFAGEEPTVGDGFRAAAARLPQILAWALLSATVGVLLKVIENAHQRGSEIISFLLGTAWTVITFFVVPVLVVEKAGPFEAIRRSVQLLKDAWGEALFEHWGLGFFMFLLAIPGVVLLFLGIGLATQVPPIGLLIVAVAIIYLLGCSAASSALNTIFLAALYQWAAYKTLPVSFSRAEIEGAFQPKSRRWDNY
jgi:hypothetical protein